jgi:phosphomannomutase/phosphoglucomutase
MVPTPLVYYATYSKAATSGVMITGSHNPPEYNGFKKKSLKLLRLRTK